MMRMFLTYAAVYFAKALPVAKLLLGIGMVFIAAAVGGLPIHDFWFDVVLFQFASGIVGGAPEPDTQLSFPRFLYTWFYRTAHLWVSAATAYFLHQTKWSTIHADGAEETHTTSSQGRS